MKKVFFLVAIALMLLACSKTAENSPSAEGGRLSTRISLMEALGHMNGLVDQLNGADTKSNYSKSFSVDNIFSVCHIPTITKSGETEDAADTMMYVVNFDNDEGYAVLAADRRMSRKRFLCCWTASSAEGVSTIRLRRRAASMAAAR